MEETRANSERLGGWPVLLLAGLTLLILASGIGINITDRDEGWYSQIVGEMRQSGDWLVPHLYGKAWLGKPPMLYWLGGLTTALLGWGEWQLRLVSVLASVANVLLIAWWATRLFNRRVGAWAGAIFITFGMTAALGKLFLVDPLLLTFILLAVILQWQMATAGVTHGRAALHGIAIGLGLLTKGPVIIIFAGAFVVATWVAYAQRRRAWLGDWRWWLWGGSFTLAVAVPWYLHIYRAAHDTFVEQFLGYELTSRLASRGQHGMPHVPGAYAIFALLCLLPWSACVPGALKAAFMNRRTDPAYPLLLTWLAIPWIFFELIRAKVPTYTLPCYSALAILLAAELVRRFDAGMRWALLRRTTRLAFSLTCLPLFIAGVFGLSAGIVYRHHFWGSAIIALGVVCIVGFAIALGLFRWRGLRAGCIGVAVATAGMQVTVGGLVNPRVDSLGFSRRCAEALNAEVRPGEQIVSCSYRESALPFYTHQPIEVIDRTALCDFVEAHRAGPPVLLAIYERDWQGLEAADQTGKLAQCLARTLRPRIFREVTGYTHVKKLHWERQNGEYVISPQRMFLARLGQQ